MDLQERLSSVDTAWLRMDRPTNLMMICGVMMLGGVPDLSELRQVIQNRMLCFHRFRQRISDNGLTARWVADPHFDLEWHVRKIALPGEAGRAELEEVVGDLISTPLDPTKPMWQFHLIELRQGSSALVLRIHHCYGDGYALMHVVDSMTGLTPDRKSGPARDLAAAPSQRSTVERVLGPAAGRIGDLGRLAGGLVAFGAGLLAQPAQAVTLLRTGVDLAAETAFIADMKPDSVTRFKGSLGVMKRVAWADTLSLFEVRAVADAFSCSINDVLLACVSAALRCYLQELGDSVENAAIRALVPVNLRPPGPVTALGNHFGLVFLDLPVDVDDPLERLFEVRNRMTQLKQSKQPEVALGILAGLGLAPVLLRERILEALAANASAVMTNVPGPRERRYLAGHCIERQIFWVPQSGGIGIGLSILSYAGKINFGVVSDVKRVPDPDKVVQLFAAQFEVLLDLALWQLCAQQGR